MNERTTKIGPQIGYNHSNDTDLEVDVFMVDSDSLQTCSPNLTTSESAVHVPITVVTVSRHQVRALAPGESFV